MITNYNFWQRWCLCILTGFLLLGCREIGTIPDTDIVFEMPPHSFGFINVDGTNWEYIDLGKGQTVSTAPIETLDGKYLVYHDAIQADNGFSVGYLSAITPQGEDKRYDIFHARSSAPSLSPNQMIIGTNQGTVASDNQASLHLFDLQTESIIKTFYTTAQGMDIGVGTNAVHGSKLFFARYYLYQSHSEIVSLDTESGDEIIIHVEYSTEDEQLRSSLFYPSVSPDGKWVAYSANRSIYIIDSDGQEKPKRITDVCMNCEQVPETNARAIAWPAAPSWSPDSQWIIYHRCKGRCKSTEDYAIFKANIQTGEEIKFLNEGLNPYWRLAQGHSQ